ncbi:lantibiotic dehydratase family protein [Sphaerisporangium corydalis]|uniref:Lantibiotic dehydratase family protein n=1 Tax=Sphaerisporangium corydalis TaxID=1441875 RepID=A0ABV9EB82_9ACTN|nr:lantibiotic dehydratase family protein [Sphaerisporangium corydalis]
MEEKFVLPNGVRVASPLVVRVAGLPMSAMERLRFEDSSTRVREIAELRERLAAEGDILADELYAVIGGLKSPPARTVPSRPATTAVPSRPAASPVVSAPEGARCTGVAVSDAPPSRDGDPEAGPAREVAGRAVLVGLRRAVHRGRRPSEREWNEHVAAVLPAGMAGRVASWVETLGERERLSARLPRFLAWEAEIKQAALREIVGDPGFQRALSQASPALYGETAKWLADEKSRPRRQSLTRLAKYAARAAAKTSPFSTFTVSGAGTWSPGGPRARFAERGPVLGVLEVNGFLLKRLVTALCADPRVAQAMPLRLNPSATLDEGTVRFLGPAPGEPIVTVPATPAVRECLRILGGGASYTMSGLRDLLDAGDRGEGPVEPFLSTLVDAGLLHHRSPVADLSADPLGELSAWLTANGGDPGTVALVDDVRWRLRHPAAVADVAGHTLRQRELGAALGRFAERAGLPSGHLTRPLDVMRENAVHTGVVAEFSMPVWRPALEDLDVVRRALGALDPALPLRVALGAYCAERFGPGARVRFLLLHEAIGEDLRRDEADQSPVVRELAGLLRMTLAPAPDLGRSHLARLRELGRIRAALHRALLPPADGDGVVRADPAVLASLAATWPEWITAPPSMACYLQVLGDDTTLRLVVNAAHGGFGRGRGRTLHLVRQAGGTPPDHTWDAAPGEPVLAEFGGMFAFSPNVRLPSVPYEIDYPFTESARPAGERIPLSDLEIVHDPATDLARLAARGLGAEVRTLHLGMMADVLLPAAARLLAQAFGVTYYMRPSTPLLASSDAWSVPETVTAHARVEVGRVTIRRARWVAATGQVPVRGKGESDASYLVRIVVWLRAHGIPERCFVRVFDGDPLTGSKVPTTRWILDKSHKPVYVDFANWYLVMAFERTLKGAGPVVVFEEALPGPQDALGPAGADPRVTELIVEISEPAGAGGA